MLFNSIDFAYFLILVFCLYWFVTNKNLCFQNTLLLASSYFFYGWWDSRFLILIFFSSMVDYLIGIAIYNSNNNKRKKLLLAVSILVNIGFLIFFKYFNFFIDSFSEAFSFFGSKFNPTRLNIILPVGISFYSFQTLSYTIDIYRKKLTPTKKLIPFLSFVSFFPQLVAGPIERAQNLLPQFFKKREFNYDSVFDGFKQMLWGLFKKVVIADSCAIIVNQIFDNYTEYSGSTLFLGAILFSFQIYCDFSGYSDMAIGTARLFGFNLKQNFNYPYFSRDIAEFWRRWHISLTTWFRDYVYIPLGGSKANKIIQLRNVFIVFIISGLWHGANFTFVFWGFINALFFIPLFLSNTNRKHIGLVSKGRIFPSLRELIGISFTFIIICIGWIFFRSESLSIAFHYIQKMCSSSLFSAPYVFGIGVNKAILTLGFIFILILVEWAGRAKPYPMFFEKKVNKVYQWLLCYLLVMLIFLFGEQQQEFIYFQF